MRTANPALSDKAFAAPYSGGEVMTIDGAVNKSMILLAVLIATAALTMATPQVGMNPIAMAGAGIAGFILAMIIIFKKTMAPTLAPIYAAVEGIFLGAVSLFAEANYPGIAGQAAGLTFGILATLLVAYRTGIIRATPNFTRGVIAATGGIFVIYLVSFVMSFFGSSIGFIHDASPIGIGFSAIVVFIASLNLVLDFNFIETGAARRAPKYMEWYAAFGLLVTLVWLYIEILRLLTKLNRRN